MPTYTYTGEGRISTVGINGELLSVGKGESFQTYKIHSGGAIIKTSDAPYFSLTKVRDAAFSSPGTKTGLLACSVIRLFTADEGITFVCNAAANPNSITLPSNQAIDIENKGEIESLIFTGAGTVSIEGY